MLDRLPPSSLDARTDYPWDVHSSKLSKQEHVHEIMPGVLANLKAVSGQRSVNSWSGYRVKTFVLALAPALV